ncbi:hypothetical protein ABE128_13425 [Bacillus subtilis]|nr:hypothetical protein [Bacillus subtilis]
MKTKEYVRIKKAPYRSIWYADKIGRIFPSLGTWENAYKVDSPDRALYIRKEDAEVIVTEKRKAAAGERVLLTAPTNTKGKYRVGDLFTVRVSSEAGVNVAEDEFMTLWHKEYEVIIENKEADEMKIDLNAMGYDELIAHGEEVMRMIRIRAYGEGYKQGKFDADMEATYMRPQEKSAQACRDEIVEQAKADVEKLTNYGDGVHYETGVFTKATCNVEFVVNRNKRTVVALLKGINTGIVYAKGIAKVAPSDCFNVHIGRAIALRRALGLAVPDEYLNAPQPTEVRVGDVIKYEESGRIARVVSMELDAYLQAETYLTTVEAYPNRIIDDSREEVGGE